MSSAEADGLVIGPMSWLTTCQDCGPDILYR